jgi:uncharacterized protein (UPF0548 family)
VALAGWGSAQDSGIRVEGIRQVFLCYQLPVVLVGAAWVLVVPSRVLVTKELYSGHA